MYVSLLLKATTYTHLVTCINRMEQQEQEHQYNFSHDNYNYLPIVVLTITIVFGRRKSELGLVF